MTDKITQDGNTATSTIDDRLAASYKSYTSVARRHSNPQVAVGRSASMMGSEPFIFKDIFQKLAIVDGDSVLNIGVGCGKIAEWWLQKANEMNLALCFVDFPDVIKKIKSEKLPALENLPEIKFVEGIFPFETGKQLDGHIFDAIEVYSVIHYTDNPRKIIEAAASQLAPGGRLLIGDIPNLDKKGRFLATAKGREFDAAYKNVPVKGLPLYKNHQSFTKEALAEGAPHIDDQFLIEILTSYRTSGFDSYVLNQADSLPFCHTREDLLIIAPHE